MKETILVVDDDELLLGFLDEILRNEGYDVVPFSSPIKAVDYLANHSVQLVITDVKMNEMTGDEILSHVQEFHSSTGLIMITGFGNINHAVRALHKGAFDYITKPFKAKEIIFRVKRFFDGETPSLEGTSEGGSQNKGGENSATTSLTREKKPVIPANSRHQKEHSTPDATADKEDRLSPIKDEEEFESAFIGEAPQIKRLMMILPQIAKNTAPVLIQGESGTGKEVFASQVHLYSNRNKAPYIKINCANLPSELVESTLFGHVKGAFTGAISDRKGAFDAAQGGTLLLDEITEIDVQVQAKLLRVLQENEFYRVGSQTPIKSDVRILATSNRNIGAAIKDRLFREDLYYRLNVFPIEIPPLRERKSDIPVLAAHFVKSYCEKYGFPDIRCSSELIEYLMEKEWRGNVRELNNKIHRGIIFAQDSDELRPDHIENSLFSNVDDHLDNEEQDLPLMPIEDMELQLIQKALTHTQGNQKQAAKLLGISDRTIRNKLKNRE
jgi:DNA-binding NtrC family response regulator